MMVTILIKQGKNFELIFYIKKQRFSFIKTKVFVTQLNVFFILMCFKKEKKR